MCGVVDQESHGGAAISPYRQRGTRSVCRRGDLDGGSRPGFGRRVVEVLSVRAVRPPRRRWPPDTSYRFRVAGVNGQPADLVRRDPLRRAVAGGIDLSNLEPLARIRKRVDEDLLRPAIADRRIPTVPCVNLGPSAASTPTGFCQRKPQPVWPTLETRDSDRNSATARIDHRPQLHGPSAAWPRRSRLVTRAPPGSRDRGRRRRCRDRWRGIRTLRCRSGRASTSSATTAASGLSPVGHPNSLETNSIGCSDTAPVRSPRGA